MMEHYQKKQSEPTLSKYLFTNSAKINVLVMCHGNKWRSPLCANILKASFLDIESAGFRESGLLAGLQAREYAKIVGIDLDEHRSQTVTPILLCWADVIIYMDGGNRKRLVKILAEHGISRPIICLGRFADPFMDRIPDPAFLVGGEREDVFVAIHRATLALRTWLKRRNTLKKKSKGAVPPHFWDPPRAKASKGAQSGFLKGPK